MGESGLKGGREGGCKREGGKGAGLREEKKVEKGR